MILCIRVWETAIPARDYYCHGQSRAGGGSEFRRRKAANSLGFGGWQHNHKFAIEHTLFYLTSKEEIDLMQLQLEVNMLNGNIIRTNPKNDSDPGRLRSLGLLKVGIHLWPREVGTPHR